MALDDSPPATRARSSRDAKAAAPTSPAGKAHKERVTRKACGPLAQLLRDHFEARRAQVVVCSGGFVIDAHGGLWHRDCPTPHDGRTVRPASATEVSA